MIDLHVIEILRVYKYTGENLFELCNGAIAPCGDGIILLLESKEKYIQLHFAERKIPQAIFLPDDCQHKVLNQAVLFHHGI